MKVKAVLVIDDRLYYGFVDTGGQITFGSGKKEVTKDETACSVGGCLNTGQC